MNIEATGSLDMAKQPLPQAYQWDFLPDLSQLGGVLEDTASMISSGNEASFIRDILSGNNAQVDAPFLRRIYAKGTALRRSIHDGLSLPERKVFESLRDAMEGWFYDSDWLRQPVFEAGDVESEDNRHHRLLLPAHLLNLLTKVVESGEMEDVGKERLFEISFGAREKGEDYLDPGYLAEVIGQIRKLPERPIESGGESVGFGHDLKSWVGIHESDIETVETHAGEILETSYDNCLKHLNRSSASGLYFMKGIVIATMQLWHQQRIGIEGMVPPIAWQDTPNGVSYYNFKNNTSDWGDMHTNNKRVPFQKYAAMYLQEQRGLK